MKKNNYTSEEVVVCIDMVNGFTKAGALADKRILKIVPECLSIFNNALQKNDELIFVRDAHSENCPEFDLYPVHCLDGSEESLIIDEFDFYAQKSIIIAKNSTNVSLVPEYLIELAKFKKLKRLIFVGCLTDVCVKEGAIGTKSYFDEINSKIEIIVPKNAVDTYFSNEEDYNKRVNDAFEEMRDSGIRVLERYRRK